MVDRGERRGRRPGLRLSREPGASGGLNQESDREDWQQALLQEGHGHDFKTAGGELAGGGGSGSQAE